MNLIKLNNISHRYINEGSEELVLKNINLSFEENKIYCIMGASGSGKSTLLNIIGGLLRPVSGEVLIGNEDITKLSESKMGKLRLTSIGYIFQNLNLLPFLNVEENIFLPLRLLKKDVNLYRESCKELLNKLDISNKDKAYISELSGGQQQRVAIARALLNTPKIILADEPTGNLDSENSKRFMEFLVNLCKEKNISVVMVTHDKKVAEYADEIINIKDGMVENKYCKEKC